MSSIKPIVIYHRADYDGLFCREIARKFMPEAELIGWDFGDPPFDLQALKAPLPRIYILDLPVDRVFGWATVPPGMQDLVWIDHHASAIASHPADIPGYRIDGVAACRLAWQWFQQGHDRSNTSGVCACLPTKEQLVARAAFEPLAVCLAGEYDVWAHEPSEGKCVSFQFGLDGQYALDWELLLATGASAEAEVKRIIHDGRAIQQCYAKRDAAIMRARSFLVQWQELTFLALNTARCNSNTFAARDVPETGHDALLAFCWDGRAWHVSLYHAAHRKDLDLSILAVRAGKDPEYGALGGGGHPGACGFRAHSLPFRT